ncbi:MAG: AAA family ATPase [Anaerobutyricum hallii]|uniref:AAA family ATPase n=1 Tax=Anaerobutyricum hallii TaxID=39488 RepID=UPI00242C1BE3|nr:AAA family ATPase [Anaerobutyricum hallii]MDD6590180.1 AAA family ATPase [Anaerobutyricum hallii]
MENRSMKIKLARYIDAGFPIIYVNTFEEDKVDTIISEINYGKEIYEWNETNGYIDFESKTPLIEDCSLEMMLDMLKSIDLLDRKIILLKDVVSYFEDAKIVSKIKGLARLINQGADATIIIVSSVLVIPKDLEKYITILEMDYLNTDEIKKIIEDFIRENLGIQDVNERLIDEFAVAFKGLTEFEILNLLALSYADDGELTKRDLRLIFDQKQQMIKKAGILEMIPLKETIDDIGGLENLKEWFKRKAKVYKNMGKAKKYGVDMPKGVLIAGVPGCGKSLNAKAAANLFEVPLLRLDMGRLMGKYVGESEGNLRNAIALAEAISPCVLWIDELEKAFAGIGGSGGGAEVTTRLFGNFLTWMQEKDSPTFVVATANDIMKLPPELLRKGRFDEIFYVGLPNAVEREKIFHIHIKKRRPQDLKYIKVNELVRKTEGFSGADIEGVVKDAVESAFADDKTSVQTQDILEAIKNTHSLSEIMKDALEKMAKEYEKRKFKNASR